MLHEEVLFKEEQQEELKEKDYFTDLTNEVRRLKALYPDGDYGWYKGSKIWELYDQTKNVITRTKAVGTDAGLCGVIEPLSLFQPKERRELAVVLAEKARRVESRSDGNEWATATKFYAFQTIYEATHNKQQIHEMIHRMDNDTQMDFKHFLVSQAANGNRQKSGKRSGGRKNKTLRL